MITAIKLANEGAYNQDGTQLANLKQLNFIFGSNGSGKTTISRVIEGSQPHPDCAITWATGAPVETRVYNRDFVEKHFETPGSIKGIYTLGDDNVEAVKAVAALKVDEEDLTKKIKKLNNTLFGEDRQSGKKKELDDLEKPFIEDIWKAKRAFDELNDAFSGLNKNKAKFVERYFSEIKNNSAEVRDIGDLRVDGGTVFSNALTHANQLTLPDNTALVALKTSAILSKRVIGKTDVDIAALIEKLGNSDWVQQGREHFEKLDDQCPFCQQKTDAAFRLSSKVILMKPILLILKPLKPCVKTTQKTRIRY